MIHINEVNPYQLMNKAIISKMDGYSLLELKENLQILDTNKIMISSENYIEKPIRLESYQKDTYITGNIILTLPIEKVYTINFNEFKQLLSDSGKELERNYYEKKLNNVKLPHATLDKILSGIEFFQIYENEKIINLLEKYIMKDINHTDTLLSEYFSQDTKIEKNFQKIFNIASLHVIEQIGFQNDQNKLIELLILSAQFLSEEQFVNILNLFEHKNNDKPFYNIKTTFTKIKKARELQLIDTHYNQITRILSDKLNHNAILENKAKLYLLK